MSKLSDGSMKTGYGNKENGDIYVVKQLENDNSNEYYLFYYNDKNEEKNIGKLFINSDME